MAGTLSDYYDEIFPLDSIGGIICIGPAALSLIDELTEMGGITQNETWFFVFKPLAELLRRFGMALFVCVGQYASHTCAHASFYVFRTRFIGTYTSSYIRKERLHKQLSNDVLHKKQALAYSDY